MKNSEFYFASTLGRSDPAAEVRAMIQTLHRIGFALAGLTAQAPLDESQNPFCRFPARVKWLRKKLPEVEKLWTFPKCPRFEAYHEALMGESVSVVFSSYFLNNPSSAFGHTFLRINKKAAEGGKRYELLDYGVNFAAQEEGTKNPLSYAFKGLFGGFRGTFTSIPYYYKVREYNNAESRDLWEYELNIAPDVVDMLIAHLWEVGPAVIDYYYLTENCSYFMMTLLDAADPSLNFAPRMKKFVIPSDTIQLLDSTPGLVKRFTYRASIRTQLQERLKHLSAAEKNEVIRILDVKIDSSSANAQKPPTFDENRFSTDQQRKILDAAIDAMDYRYSTEVQYPASAEAQYKNQLLIARSQIELTTPPLRITPPEHESPHLSHHSRRFSLGSRFSDQGGSYISLGYRFALHDQLDFSQGYPDYAEITFGDMQFEYSLQEKHFELETFSLFEVVSHTPWNSFDPHFSWRVRLGVDRLRSENFVHCHAGVAEWGSGITAELQNPRFSFYTGAKVSGFYSPSCNGTGFAGIGPEVRLRYKWSPKLISLFEGHFRYDIDQGIKNYRELSLGTQYSFTRLNGLRLKASEKGFEQSIGIEWVNYH